MNLPDYYSVDLENETETISRSSLKGGGIYNRYILDFTRESCPSLGTKPSVRPKPFSEDWVKKNTEARGEFNIVASMPYTC